MDSHQSDVLLGLIWLEFLICLYCVYLFVLSTRKNTCLEVNVRKIFPSKLQRIYLSNVSGWNNCTGEILLTFLVVGAGVCCWLCCWFTESWDAAEHLTMHTTDSTTKNDGGQDAHPSY